MKLAYHNKQTEKEILDKIPEIDTPQLKEIVGKNLLLKGENLIVMKHLVTKLGMRNKIDLIYIDPPFATNNTFTIANGRASTISNQKDGIIAYTDKLQGENFIEYIRERLVLLKMLLSDKGSIYLHIDYKIGHYVKVVMDEVFGIENFRNDITRIKCNPKNFARKGYGNVKDLILFYSKSNNLIWNEPQAAYTEADKANLFKQVDETGRPYTTIPLHAPGETKKGKTNEPFKGILPPNGRHWRSEVAVLEQLDNEGLIEWSSKGNPRKKIYLDEQGGKRIQDIWEFKDPQYPVYPTEKNDDLLDLIIKTSSNKDSLVLDCFCGSGTTLIAANKNNRQWIGIDQATEAIKATELKLKGGNGSLFDGSLDYYFYDFESIFAINVNGVMTE